MRDATTPFDMAVLNDIDRFHLVNDVANRVLSLGSRAAYLTQLVRDKLIDHKRYIERYGDDMPEIRDWRWGARRNTVSDKVPPLALLPVAANSTDPQRIVPNRETT